MLERHQMSSKIKSKERLLRGAHVHRHSEPFFAFVRTELPHGHRRADGAGLFPERYWDGY